MRTLSLTIFAIGICSIFLSWSWFSGTSIHDRDDAEAANFMAYRSAVLRYAIANPGALGEISFTALQPHAPIGSTELLNYGYKNKILASREVFVYKEPAYDTTTLVSKASTDLIRNTPGIGYSKSQQLISPGLGAASIIIPFTLADNSLVSYVRLHP